MSIHSLDTTLAARQVTNIFGSVLISNFPERDCVRSTSRSAAAGLQHSRAPAKSGHFQFFGTSVVSLSVCLYFFEFSASVGDFFQDGALSACET